MITQPHRFRGRSSLTFVHRHGQNVRRGPIALRYALNTRRSTYRLAVVVSRKTSKSAVVRNRIRRRIFEIIRLQSDDVTAPYDLVFSVYGEDVADIPHDRLAATVTGLLRTAGVVGAKRP